MFSAYKDESQLKFLKGYALQGNQPRWQEIFYSFTSNNKF